jgi:hypothetical protein
MGTDGPDAKDDTLGAENTPVCLDRLDRRVHVDSAPASSETKSAMARSFLDSDYPAALALAEQVLSARPDDAMARAIAHECQVIMEIGPSVPVRQIVSAEPFDDRTASVLLLVDGRMTVEEIVYSSGLGPLETVRVIEELVEGGVLRLEA